MGWFEHFGIDWDFLLRKVGLTHSFVSVILLLESQIGEMSLRKVHSSNPVECKIISIIPYGAKLNLLSLFNDLWVLLGPKNLRSLNINS